MSIITTESTIARRDREQRGAVIAIQAGLADPNPVTGRAIGPNMREANRHERAAVRHDNAADKILAKGK